MARSKNDLCLNCKEAPVEYRMSPKIHNQLIRGYCKDCYERLSNLESSKLFQEKLDEWGLDADKPYREEDSDDREHPRH